ncbi:FxSxx-COOH system tetratricopeptide repeat protein [Myxococcus xanthus]|nr:FxSxx-COOH system tetratricopeptide repeat protein [Myxococcus xanthus]
MTALQVEFRAVRSHLKEAHEKTHPEGTVYEQGHFHGQSGTWEVLLVEVGAGNTRTAFETERAIQFFLPEVVLFVGVAGGLKDVSIGDVVFAPKVYGYESGKETEQFEPRPDVGESSYPLEQRARAIARRDDWKSRIPAPPPSAEPRALPGPIAAGEKVVASTRSEQFQRLRRQYGDAVAVEMEGRGFLIATRANRGVDALVIRGISDCIDAKAAADATGSQELASQHASAFAFELLATFRLPPAPSGARALPTEPVWTVPYPPNPNFTGRAPLLKTIRTHFLSTPTRALALHGLGGVGKTQLAVEYARRHALDTPDHSHILWVRADEPAVLAASYAGLSDALGLPEATVAEQSVRVKAVRLWLQRNTGWLLVFDNARQEADLRPYLPLTTAPGHILVTSLNPAWRGLATPCQVDVLDRAESTDFLLRRTGQTDTAGARALAGALGDLPLALAQAAAYMEQTQKPLADYLSLFERHRQRLLSRPGPPSDYPHTVEATWELSFEQVQSQSPAGAALLSLCAFMAPSPIPSKLLVEGAALLPEQLSAVGGDELLMDEAISALSRYSLVQVLHHQLLFHRLVQAVKLDRLGGERGRGEEAALRLLHKLFVFDTYDLQTWTRCAELLPHAMAVCENARSSAAGKDLLPELLWRLGSYLETQAEYSQARALLEQGLDLVRKHPGDGSLTEARFIAGLGDIATNLGEYPQAQTLLEQASQLLQASGPSDDSKTDVANILASFSGLALSRGALIDAENKARQALSLHTPTTKNGGYSTCLFLLGATLTRQARFEEAAEYLAQALTLAEARLEPRHPAVAVIRAEYARVLEKLGRYREARELLERSLTTLEAIYGPNHPHVALDLKGLGNTYLHLGDPTKARDFCERALQIEEERLGPSHPEVATTLNNLARALHKLKNLEGSKDCFQRAIAIKEASNEQDDGMLATFLDNYGQLLDELRENEAARECFERSLALHEHKVGPEHPNVANVCNNLGNFLARGEDLPEARRYIERALAIDEKVYGPQHMEVAIDLNNLAPILFQQKKWMAGVEMFERAVAIFSKQDPLPHRLIISALMSLSAAYEEADDIPTAQARMEKAIELQEQFQPEDIQSAEIHQQLGRLLYFHGQGAQAVPHLEKALGFAGAEVEPVRRLYLLTYLGGALRVTGELQAARPRLEAAKRLAHATNDKRALCIIQYELGQIFHEEGELAAAEGTLEQALELGKEIADARAQLRILSPLTLVLEEQDKLLKASHRLKQALELSRALYGSDKLITTQIAARLGQNLLDQREPAAARPYLEQALAFYSQLDSSFLDRRLSLLGPLGQACFEVGDLERAEDCAKQTLSLCSAATPTSALGMASAHIALGCILQAKGAHREAEAEFEQVMRLGEQQLGSTHRLRVRAISALSQLHYARGSLRTSRDLSERAVRIQEAWAEEEPFGLMQDLILFARVLWDLGETEPALEQLSRAEALCRKHASAQQYLFGIFCLQGEIHLSRADWKKVRECIERALRYGNSAQLTPANQSHLHNVLGTALSNLDQPKLSLVHLEKALVLSTKALGAESTECAIVMFTMALPLQGMGKTHLAIKKCKRALTILTRVEPAHPLIPRIRDYLGQLDPAFR